MEWVGAETKGGTAVNVPHVTEVLDGLDVDWRYVSTGMYWTLVDGRPVDFGYVTLANIKYFVAGARTGTGLPLAFRMTPVAELTGSVIRDVILATLAAIGEA